MTTRIQALKTQIETLRARLNADYVKAFTEQSADLRARLAVEVYTQAYYGRRSLNSLAKEYGTKNWQTVKDLYLLGESLSQSQTEQAVDNYTIQVEPLSDGVAQVTVTDTVEDLTARFKAHYDLKAVAPYVQSTEVVNRIHQSVMSNDNEALVAAIYAALGWED